MQSRKSSSIDRRQRVAVILRLSSLGIAIFLAIYIYTYWFSPLPGLWNDLLTNLYGILAAGLCTAAATAICLRYRKSDGTYIIWMNFALGLFAWFLADTVWGIYNMTVVELPPVSWADLFYMLGYCFFFVALHRQFIILFQPNLRRDVLVTAGLAAAVIVVSLLSAQAFTSLTAGHLDMSNLLNGFYPIGDLSIALLALVFVVNFGRGAFGRPWLGLAIFAVTDSLYAWLYESGTYAYSVQVGNLLSLTADALYTATYLILAVLLLRQYFLVRYGPSVLSSRKRTAKSKR